MSLLKYWPTTDEINACIKHEAEGAHDAVLLAAHRPSPLSYKQISSGEKFNASEEALFEYLISNIGEGFAKNSFAIGPSVRLGTTNRNTFGFLVILINMRVKIGDFFSVR